MNTQWGFTIKSNRGASLIQVMIASAVAGIVSLLIVSVMQNLLKMNKQINVKTNAIMIKQSIVSILQNSESWEHTLDANTVKMGCIKNGVSCAAYADLDEVDPDKREGELFVLKDSHNNTVRGFTSNGVPCTGFVDPTAGADGPLPGVDSCPFGVVLKFLADCPDASNCIKPLVKISGYIYYNSRKQKFPYNPENNKIDFIRSGDSVAYMCAQFGGTYNSAAKTCGGVGNTVAVAPVVAAGNPCPLEHAFSAGNSPITMVDDGTREFGIRRGIGRRLVKWYLQGNNLWCSVNKSRRKFHKCNNGVWDCDTGASTCLTVTSC